MGAIEEKSSLNMAKMTRITVAIPTHSMQGGAGFLKNNFDILRNQIFKDFDVVISDNSEDDIIENVCKEYSDLLPILYYKNPSPLKEMASNTNSAIRFSTGELIKILFLDDFLNGPNALLDISNFFREKDYWLVTGCIHTYDGIHFERMHFPNYHKKIHEGANTIGSPSVLTIRNNGHLLFDESLTWLLDCDLYKRYYEKYGMPRILNSISTVIRQGEHQVTNLLSKERKVKEYDYLIKKYPNE